jgi:hypothetical protein
VSGGVATIFATELANAGSVATSVWYFGAAAPILPAHFGLRMAENARRGYRPAKLSSPPGMTSGCGLMRPIVLAAPFMVRPPASEAPAVGSRIPWGEKLGTLPNQRLVFERSLRGR